MGKFGIGELLVILVIIVILFGARRLPELAKGLGQAIKEFKKAGREPLDAAVEEKKGG